MKIFFTKMQSYGNDFVIIDFREENANKDFTANEIIYLADRNYGIGCDQLIVLYKSEIPEDDKSISVNVKIYNNDGTIAMNCGNGMKCIAGYVLRNSIKSIIRIKIGNSVISAKADKDKKYSKVNIGIPDVQSNIVTIGNKHKIVMVENFDSLNKVPDPEFNISYVKLNSKSDMFVRTVERGVGETLSCGTGVCASAAYCIVNNLVDKNVKILTRGADIMNSTNEVTWDGVGKPMLFGGYYSFVYTGDITIVD